MTSRKLDMIAAAKDGKPVSNSSIDKIENEFDSVDTQLKILTPEATVLKLLSGEEVELPDELTLNDLFRNKVFKTVRYCFAMVRSELDSVRKGRALKYDDPILFAILFKPSVQTVLEETLSVVTKRPPDAFIDQLDEPNSAIAFAWIHKTLELANGKVTGKVSAVPADPKK